MRVELVSSTTKPHFLHVTNPNPKPKTTTILPSVSSSSSSLTDTPFGLSENWAPHSWKSKKALQLPEYPNPDELGSVLNTLEAFPPIVFAGEARKLEERLAQAAFGEAFLLQGGDCAESFKEFNANNIRDNFRVLLQMGIVLTYRAQIPIIKSSASTPSSSPEADDSSSLRTLRFVRDIVPVYVRHPDLEEFVGTIQFSGEDGYMFRTRLHALWASHTHSAAIDPLPIEKASIWPGFEASYETYNPETKLFNCLNFSRIGWSKLSYKTQRVVFVPE